MSEYQEYTVRVYKNKTEYRNKEGKLHRDGDLPAVERFDGTKYWYQYDKLHRGNDFPAVEYPNGTKYWYQNGELHRLGGPAIEIHNGNTYWYIEGIKYTVEEFNKKIYQNKLSSCEGKVVVIDGVEYLLHLKASYISPSEIT